MEIISFWPIFFFAVFFQGLFLSVILAIQQKGNKGNVYLAMLILLFSISILDTVIYWTEYYLQNPHFLGISLGFGFLYGPLFYIYLGRITRQPDHSFRKSWKHFIPYLLVLVWDTPYYLSNTIDKLNLIEEWNQNLLNALVIPLLGLISLIGYGIYSYRHIKVLEKRYEIKIIGSDHWLGLIFMSYMVFVGFNTFYFLNLFFGRSIEVSDIIIALGYSAFIYPIGYLGLKTSKLLNGIKVDTTKYQSALLPAEFSKEMFDKLNQHVVKHEVYKNSEIKLKDLANALSISPHRLSQIINQNAGQNFSEYINSYRIEEAIKLISQMDRVNLLSYKVGFNNRTTFNKVFKRRTGLTPTEYKKKLDREDASAEKNTIELN